MWNVLRRRGRAAQHRPDVTVVTREGCYLCEEMLTVVGAELGPEGPAATTLDLDAALGAGQITPEQHARWTIQVPVLLVDGQEVAHHRVEPGRITALLGGAARGRGRRGSRRFGG